MGNRFNNQFNDGSYFSQDGQTIHAANGKPLLYRDDITGNFHRFEDGAAVLYPDPFGERLFRHTNVPPLREE
jgi:hypothetical protein